MSKKDRATLNSSLKTTEENITGARNEYQTLAGAFRTERDRIQVTLARLIAQGASLLDSLGRDWREWAGKQGEGFGSPKDDGTFGGLTPPSLYRYRNAGVIADMIGEDVGGAAYTALVPLYRFVAASKTPDDMTAAAEVVKGHWTEACKASGVKSPTEESVRALVETASGTTRGKQGATAKQRKTKQTAKNARSRNKVATDDKQAGAGETIKVDPAKIESVAKIIEAQMRQYGRKGIDASVVRPIMLATVRLCKEHGHDVVTAALTGASSK